MARVLTFSRFFPAYHPKAGQPTHFIEKINKSLGFEYGIPFGDQTEKHFKDQEIQYSHKIYSECKPKNHTIRVGHGWKTGDKFSPRVWSGKPYQSKQIIIAPDIEVKKIWDFEIKTAYKELPLDYETDVIINHKFYHTDDEIMKQLALNDGLLLSELLHWFKYPKPFTGQIICWSENINY